VVLRERIKRAAKLRIRGRDFYNVTPLNPAEVNVIVKVDGSRRPRRNATDLQAGFRKHQRLTGGRNFQMPHQGSEISMLWFPIQLDLPRLKPRSQASDGVGGFFVAVVDRFLFMIQLPEARSSNQQHRQNKQ
jgi:hypothetical protein